MRNLWKKIVAGIFAFALVLTGMNLLSMEGSKVQAADTETSVKYYVQTYTGTEVKAHKDAKTAPVPTPVNEEDKKFGNWIFAGWFTDKECKTALGETIDESKEDYHAKFVPAEVLSVKAQVKTETTNGSTSTDMRLVGTVDSLQYKKVGFEVYYNGSAKPVVINTTTVYERIQAGKGGVEYGFSPNIFDTQSEYFVTATLKNIANKNFDKSFYIRPYWVTLDGTTVYGVSRYARVEDSYLNIVNVPVRLVSDSAEATTGTVSMAYNKDKFTYLDTYESTLLNDTVTSTQAYANGSIFGSITVDGSTAGTIVIKGPVDATQAEKINGEIAHLRLKVDLKNGATMSKKNVFEVSSTDLADNIVVADSVYNHFGISENYSGSADTSWYDKNENEFVITTAEELYGLSSLVDAATFTTEKVYLGSDIVINTGFATDWVNGTNATGLHQWQPIGTNSNSFKGTFDGQGHTIKGMYLSGRTNDKSNWRVGLFGVITGATITNIRLENSLIEAGVYVGSICGQAGNSTLTHLYSDAIIRAQYGGGDSGYAGGITGDIVDGGTLTDCWFAGDLISGNGGNTGGLIGRVVNKGEVIVQNCLNSRSVSSTGSRVGGLIGWIQNGSGNTPTVKVSQCLNVGSVNSSSTTSIGAVVGDVDAILYVDKNSVHAVEQSGLTNTIGDGFAGILYDIKGNKITSGQTTYIPFSATANITGDKAYQNTGLDYDATWVARQKGTPVLEEWCASGAIYKYDTEWIGSGREDDPYIIKTANELYGLAQKVNSGEPYTGKFFKLGADILINTGTASAWGNNAPTYTWIPIGTLTNPFKGTFDGCGHTIKGMYLSGKTNDKSNWRVGLFGVITGATITNIRLENSLIEAGVYVGSICGQAGNSTLTHLYSDAIIRAQYGGGDSGYAGGITGDIADGGTLTDCWFAGDLISGNGGNTGGLIGRVVNKGEVTVQNCLNSGILSSTGSRVGGLIGWIQNGASNTPTVKVSECLNSGSVSSTSSASIGAVVGDLDAILRIDKTSVYTVQSGLTYSIGDGIAGILQDINGTQIQSNHNNYIPFTADSNLKGGNAYLKTYLDFDRPELPTPTEGVWVAREGKCPGLKIFVAEEDRMELVGDYMYRADTRWYNGADNEFTIDTAEELVGFASLVSANTSFAGKTVKLDDDIIINTGKASDWYAGNNTSKLFNWTPMGVRNNGFDGTFAGENHTISGVYSSQTLDGTGFFRQIKAGATVKEFSLVNSCFKGNQGVAALCGWYAAGTIDTVYTDAYVKASSAHSGGLVMGSQMDAVIKNCWFDGEISGVNHVGGISGYVGATGVQIESCLFTGKIVKGTENVGGILGLVTQPVTIKDTLSAGSVTGTSSYVATIGGNVQNAITCTDVYVLGASSTLIKGTGSITGAKGVDDLTGAKGYMNTCLSFERPELPQPTKGAWVVTSGLPKLKSFSASERIDLDGQNMYRADTRWYNTTDTEFTIDTAEELVGFASLVSANTSFVGKTVKLGADITINTGKASDWYAGNNTSKLYNWTPMGVKNNGFDGIFAGGNHTISGIYSLQTTDGTGFFRQIKAGATVKEFSIVNSCFSGKQGVAALCGWYSAGTIESIYTDAYVKATAAHAGGLLMGSQANSIIKNCWFAGEVDGNAYVGGITGYLNGAGQQIESCLFTGKIHATDKIGGIIGHSNQNVTIDDSLSAGTLSCKNATGSVGAIAGNIDSGMVASCESVYALGASSTLYKGAGSMTGATVVAELNSYKGYMNTNLDFDNRWVAMENTAPVLRSFAPVDGRFDTTSWYTKAQADGEGNQAGTEKNPYLIDSIADMYGVVKRVNTGVDTFDGKYIKLTKSLTFNEGNPTSGNWETNAPYYEWTPIGKTTARGNYDTAFKGTFDGDNYVISGIYVPMKAGEATNIGGGNWYKGLFGWTNGATIQNFSLKNSYFKGSYYVAGVVGALIKGTCKNVFSDANIIATNETAGGISSYVASSTIQSCWFDGSVSGQMKIGGILGVSVDAENTSHVKNCLTSGKVEATSQRAGGIVGGVECNLELDNCLSAGEVISPSQKGTVAGRLDTYTFKAVNTYGYAAGTNSNKPTTALGYQASGTVISAPTLITDITTLYDTKAYNKLDGTYWTARVDSYPIPSVFANGDYANAAQQDAEYVSDLIFEGEGTEGNPYEISSAAELYGLALLSQTNSYTGVVFELTDNITVNPVTIDTSLADGTYYDWLPIGNGDYPFAGKFIGNGYTISGLYKAREAEKDLGLFARTTVDAVVEDFTLTNTYFHWLNGTSDAARMGAVAGRGGGTFTDIHSSAVVTSSWYGSGGIIGEANSNTTITNCWFDGAVKGLRTNGSSYTGGMIGLASGGNIAINHSLVSGSAAAWKNVGGFIGGAKGTIQVTLEDNLFSGTITDGSSGYAGQFIGSVEGSDTTTTEVEITKCFGVSDDVAEDIGVLTSSPTIRGKAGSSVKADRLIGYTGTDAGLDFVTYWVLTKNSTPGLKTFTTAEDVYDGTGIDALLQLTYWDKTLANTEDKGVGNYMVTVEDVELGEIDGTTANSYYGYLAALAANGFAAYSNDNGLNSEGVYNAIYTKGTEWVVNVTYISYKENDNVTPKIYITFNTGQPLSTHLKATDVASIDYSATDGYSVAQDKVTYHMLESSYAGFGAGSYIMQLKNGHFIIIDGGVYNDVSYLFEYLESFVAEGTKPIVEAWVFSHSHSDHMGPMLGIMQDVDAYKDRIYVEGFYYNEPNGDIVETYAKDAYSLVQALKNCAAQVLRTTEDKAPQIYRIQTGQRYTFDGVEMDVMLSQELLTLADYEATNNINNSYQLDSFNDTSTWCMFTIGEGNDAQKLFSSGDGSYSGKKYVCDIYSSSYMTVDVFTALHHGLNTNMSQYMVISNSWESVNQEAFSKKCTVEGVVLYSYKYDMTKKEEDPNGVSDPVNWKYANLNKSFITYLEEKSTTFEKGIPVKYLDADGSIKSQASKNYLFFGEGACKLTFHGKTATNPITAEVLPNYDFTK